MKLQSHEIQLIGGWKQNEVGEMIGDEVSDRIDWLVKNDLTFIKSKDWAELYLDSDNNYWELSFPQSHMHGGGPRMIQKVSVDTAKLKFNVLPDT